MFAALSDKYAVAGQITPADVVEIATMGFTTVICNRPDGEDAGQPGADEIRAACESHGLEFHLLPIVSPGIDPATVVDFIALYRSASRRVLGYCRSGTRSAMLWQIAAHQLD